MRLNDSPHLCSSGLRALRPAPEVERGNHVFAKLVLVSEYYLLRAKLVNGFLV